MYTIINLMTNNYKNFSKSYRNMQKKKKEKEKNNTYC